MPIQTRKFTMKNFHLLLIVIVIFVLALQQDAFSYETAFEKTAVGAIEVKTLPATRALVATDAEGDFFKNRDRLFKALFAYIKEHDIKMTVPVEGHMKPARMVFFLGKRYQERILPDRGKIKLVELPKRTVIALGKRGAYSRENFTKARLELQQWMKKHPEYIATGEAYAVFWSAPYVPRFLKRFEVHVPLMTEGRGAPLIKTDAGWFEEVDCRVAGSASTGKTP